MTDLAVASTFSGVGGIDLGFHAAGIPTRLLCEYDRHAASVLARRFPGVPIHPDVTELTADDLAAAGLRPESTILLAGFPCTDLSVAGARKGMGRGTRSGLYWHVDRLMAEFRPAWVVLENVPGLLSATCACPGDGRCVDRDIATRCAGDTHSVPGGACWGECIGRHGGVMGAVLGSLAKRGYGFAYRVLDAQFFGVPQRRRRVIIVGRLGDSGAAPAQVLLEPEGGGWDSAAGHTARAGAARNTARGARRAGREVVSTLQASGGDRGYRVDAEAAAGGHLIPATFQKVIRSGERDADGNLPPEVWAERNVAATLNLHDLGSDTRAVDVVVQPILEPGSRTGVSTTDPRAGMGIGDETDPMFTLQAGRTHGIAVTTLGDRTHTLTGEGHDASEDGTGRGTPIIAATLTAGVSQHGVNPPGRRQEDDHNLVAETETTVRRLTPLECERLQGHPDNWTEGQADSHRYKQMGNGVAVPVFAWVAHRLAAVHRAGDRFWSKVDVAPEGCWTWTGALSDGYGAYRTDEGSTARAHRIAYERCVGPVPDGTELDHTCHNKACVRPDHLDPVPHRENIRRHFAQVTECPRGHAYDEANTYVNKGRRYCRTCNRQKQAERKARA